MNIILKNEHNDVLIKNIGENLKKYWGKRENSDTSSQPCKK